MCFVLASGTVKTEDLRKGNYSTRCGIEDSGKFPEFPAYGGSLFFEQNWFAPPNFLKGALTMVEEHESASWLDTAASLQGCRLKPWLTLFALSLCTVPVLAKDSQLQATTLPNLLGAAPAVNWSQVPPVMVAVFDDDLLAPFTQLRVGMTAAEVLDAMRHKPQRQETSSHLGLEIQRLVWRHWPSGSIYQVVLVAGRLVSKSKETKPLFG